MNLQLDHLTLRPLGDDRTLLHTPDGQFEIQLPPSHLSRLLARCDGTRDRTALLTDSPEGFDEILTALADQQPPVTTPEHPPHGLLLGEADLCDRLTGLLSDFAATTQVQGKDLANLLKNDRPHCVIVLQNTLDMATLETVDAICREHNTPWVSLRLELGKGWLGPLVWPGHTADVHDWAGRRTCAGDHVEAGLLKPSILNHMHPRAISWLLGRFAGELNHFARTGHARLLSCELECDPVTYDVRSHVILPLPTRAHQVHDWRCGEADPEHQIESPRTGVVLSRHQVDHHESVPKDLITVRAHCGDLSRIYAFHNDLFTGGSQFYDARPAAGAALGEALERYCGNCLNSDNLRQASYAELHNAGENALDPDRLILHSKTMLDTPGCPFVHFTHDRPVRWIKGRSLTQNRDIWLPISLVYANWYLGDLADEPLTNYLYTPGMAAGQNLERALVGAIRELVERDITMAWWLNSAQLPTVTMPHDLEKIWRDVGETYGQEFRLIHLENEFDIPVMAGIVENRRDKLINVGFGCRPDPKQAALKAFSEALTLQEGSRDLLQPDSTLRKSADEWKLLNVSYKPYRQDRSYLDAFRSDFRDVDDLMLQQQIYLDPRAIERARPILDPPTQKPFESINGLPNDDFKTYQEKIEAKGFEILYADITTPDIALTPYKVVRVIIPGLIPNMPAAFPATGGPRVTDLPVQLGWREMPLTEEQLNYFPMPHA